MSPIAPSFCGIPPRNLPKAGRGFGRNSCKLLIIFLLPGLAACSSARGSRRESDLLVELRAENARLEERLTEVQERDLKGDRTSREACAKEQKGNEVAVESDASDKTSSMDTAPDDLPIVRLSPGAGSEQAESEEEFAQSPSLSALELKEGEQDSSTRPVLKISGTQEGQVYHRPLNSDEQEASMGEQAAEK
jgi:hypothetical protein